jgi:hypothetical protein
MANYARDIVIFGTHYRNLHSAEERYGQSEDGCFLNPSETSFIREQATYDGSHIVAECQKRLDLGIQYYYGIRHQITSILQAWDAVIAEKNRSDEVGWQAPSREYLDALHTCLYLIPQRVRVGLLGPFEGAEGVNASDNSIHSARNTQKPSSNIENTPITRDDVIDGLPDYEDSAESSQRTQARCEEDPEVLALTLSDVECTQWDCISTSSDDSDKLSLNEDKDDDDNELPPREEGTSEPIRGGVFRSWHRFLRENEPVKLGPGQLNRETSVLGSAVPSKRKLAYDDEEDASCSFEKRKKLGRKVM